MLKALTHTIELQALQMCSSETKFTTGAPQRGTVLVIESEKLIRNWLRWVLHSRGYEVVTAATTQEADHQLYQVGVNQFDLVIADVNLKLAPDRTPLAGYQLYQSWKRSFPTMPFLLMSDEAHDRELADVAKGAVRLLVKRFVIAELMEAVRLLCRHQSPAHATSTPIALSA